MANTSGEKELKRKWPNTVGLTARTTKQEGQTMNLIPQTSSKVLRKTKTGL